MGEDGKGFFPKWTSHRESLDTEDFQQEFEEVLEALVGDEQYGGFLKSRDAMRDFCRGHQESGYDMVRGLTDFRNDALRDGKPTEDVDDLILKIIDAPTKREKRRADREAR